MSVNLKVIRDTLDAIYASSGIPKREEPRPLTDEDVCVHDVPLNEPCDKCHEMSKETVH